MKKTNTLGGLNKVALTTLIFSFFQYSQALSQNLNDNNAARHPTSIIPYSGNKAPIADTTRATVLPGSATGFMALLRELGMTNEVVVLQAGVALQNALEENFPTYNKVITPETKLMYIPSSSQVIVTFPDGNTLTATIKGTTKKPQTTITVNKQEPIPQDEASGLTSSLVPITHSATPSVTRNIAPIAAPTIERGVVTPIGATGIGGALKKTIPQDYHDLPIPSIANQAGLFIHNDLATIVGDTLPNNLFIQTIRDNQIGGLRVRITQKTIKVEKVETGTFKTTKSGKKIPVYKTIRTPISTKIAEYGITNEGTKVHTYSIDITD